MNIKRKTLENIFFNVHFGRSSGKQSEAFNSLMCILGAISRGRSQSEEEARRRRENDSFTFSYYLTSCFVDNIRSIIYYGFLHYICLGLTRFDQTREKLFKKCNTIMKKQTERVFLYVLYFFRKCTHQLYVVNRSFW